MVSIGQDPVSTYTLQGEVEVADRHGGAAFAYLLSPCVHEHGNLGAGFIEPIHLRVTHGKQSTVPTIERPNLLDGHNRLLVFTRRIQGEAVIPVIVDGRKGIDALGLDDAFETLLPFDAMSHDWILRFLRHRIADKRILRLIAKWLKVGITAGTKITRSSRGAPQGAVISPILANIYLHYVFDLWSHVWRRKRVSGAVIIIRYADDTVLGFQYEREARAILQDVQARLRKFELALHPKKTRLIRFGHHAAEQRKRLGQGKPETFDFLGFTHFCTRSRKYGSFVIGRKTIKKRMRAQLQAIKMELRRRLHDPIAKTGAWLKRVLIGHLNDYAVSGNDPSLWWFFTKVRWTWLRALRRRSQRAFINWEKFSRLLDRFFPPIRILHPLPCHRFDARTRGRSPVR